MATYKNLGFDEQQHDDDESAADGFATGLREAIEVGRTGDEHSHRAYHVHYWRSASGHVLDDVEMMGDENIQSTEIYDVNRKQRNSKRFWSFVLLAVAVFLSVITAVGLLLTGGSSDQQPLPADGQPLFAVRLSAGATRAHTDPRGTLWIPDATDGENSDSFEIVGESATHAFPPNVTVEHADPFEQELYRSERYFVDDSGLGGYEIAVPRDAFYRVSLHFAELWFDSCGERVMDIYVEGVLLRKNFDIFRSAEARFAATVLSCQSAVSDGSLSIQFVSKLENAKISGVEVTYVADL